MREFNVIKSDQAVGSQLALRPTRFARSPAGPTGGAERGKTVQGLRSEMGNKPKKRK